MIDWFSTLAAKREPPLAAASELQERNFVVCPGPVRSGRMGLLADAYADAVASATLDDIRFGSTTARVNDFVNRMPIATTSMYFRPCSKRVAVLLAGRSSRCSRGRCGRISPLRNCTLTFGATLPVVFGFEAAMARSPIDVVPSPRSTATAARFRRPPIARVTRCSKAARRFGATDYG